MRRKIRLSGIRALLTAKIWGYDNYYTMCFIKYYTLTGENYYRLIVV